MPKNVYDIGDIVVMTANFTDLAGAPASPTNITCTVRAPSGIQTTPATTGAGTPTGTAETTPNESGIWWYAFDGGPNVKASGENYFAVRTQEVPR